MSFIYITGSSGAGKSTIRLELQKRGYESHDTDENGLSNWTNNSTGKIVSLPHEEKRPQDWFDNHGFMLDKEKVYALKARSKEHDVYLCGIPANDIDFFSLFDKIIFLKIDKETMIKRVIKRQNNSFGQSEDEMATMLKWFDKILERYQNADATIIDATRPIEKVVDNIIELS